MEAIPTTYSGLQFRSRLEAQYALLFDLLYLDWAYEPAKFTVGLGLKKGYIPDFYLKDLKIWVEIKPPNFEDDQKYVDFYEMMGDCFVIIKGSPFDSVEFVYQKEEGKLMSYLQKPVSFVKSVVDRYQPIGPAGSTFSASYEDKAKALKHYIWSFDFENHTFSDYGAKIVNKNDMGMEIRKVMFREIHGRNPKISKPGEGCNYCQFDELQVASDQNECDELLECQVCLSIFSKD